MKRTINRLSIYVIYFITVNQATLKPDCSATLTNPNQCKISRHYHPVSETPFKWRFAGGPIAPHIFILIGILAKNEGPGEIVCMYKLNPSLIHVALIYQRDDLFNCGLLTNGSRTLANGLLNFEKATRHKKDFLY